MSETKVIPKPQLRNLFMNKMKLHFVGMSVVSIGLALLFKVTYMDPKKKKMREYFQNYDLKKHMQILKENNLLQAVLTPEETAKVENMKKQIMATMKNK